jgi:DNA mismatch repair protein MutL
MCSKYRHQRFLLGTRTASPVALRVLVTVLPLPLRRNGALDMALATMACHGAIRAGDPLSVEEGAALLRSLDEASDFAGHCPHGRPIVYSIPLDELERKLGR